MANGHGGHRTPSNPAPVSGPGALSRRTDGQPIRNPGGLPYGDNKELATTQAAAPMAQAAPMSVSPGQAAGMLEMPTAGIFAPTQYADEPLTNGSPAGPGGGPEILASGGATGPTRTKLMASLPMLMRAAEQPDASPELRTLVRYLRSKL